MYYTIFSQWVYLRPLSKKMGSALHFIMNQDDQIQIQDFSGEKKENSYQHHLDVLSEQSLQDGLQKPFVVPPGTYLRLKDVEVRVRSIPKPENDVLNKSCHGIGSQHCSVDICNLTHGFSCY